MKTGIVVSALLLSAFILACAQEKPSHGNSEAQLAIDALCAKLDNYEIGRIEILQIPPSVIETRSRIAPDMLEKGFDYKLTIRDIRGGAYREGFIKAMKSVSVEIAPEMPNLRWGVIFYDLEDRRVDAIYLTKRGYEGAVGNVPVTFEGKIFKWLDSNFSCCFR